MASTEVAATRYECDGCGRIQLVDVELNGPAHGYHGDVMAVDGSGGYGGDWYACKRSCIQRAVIAAVERPR